MCGRIHFDQLIVDTINIEDKKIAIYKNGDGIIKGLPAPTPDRVYIASRLLAEHVKRPDVVCPNTAPGHVKRNIYGMPTAVDSFITYAPMDVIT